MHPSRMLICVFLIFGITLPGVVFAQAKANLKVGAVLPLTGSMSTLGKQVLAGAEVAVAEFVKQNPDMNQRITIYTEDNVSDPTKTEAAVQKLHKDRRVDVYFGSVTGPVTLSLARAAAALGKPTVAPVATSDLISRQGDMIFRSCSIDRYQGITLARFTLEQLKKTKAALLINRLSEYSVSIGEAYDKAMQRHAAKVVANLSYEPGNANFTKLARELKKAGPEVIVLPTYYQEAAAIIRDLRTAGIGAIILGPDGWDSPQMIDLLPKTNSGTLYFSTPFFATTDDPAVVSFAAAFKSAGNNEDPTLFAAHGYDGMMVILDAFKRANSHLPKPLTAAIAATMEAPGVLGSMRMSRERNVIKPFAMLRLNNSGIKYVQKVSPAQ